MRPHIHIPRRLVEISSGLLWAIGLSWLYLSGPHRRARHPQGHLVQFLAGDDIRQTCGPNGLPRYRLVYNGRYEEQPRSYDLVGLDGGGARLAENHGKPSLWVFINDPW